MPARAKLLRMGRVPEYVGSSRLSDAADSLDTFAFSSRMASVLVQDEFFCAGIC